VSRKEERKGKERKGKERKGKERKGKERRHAPPLQHTHTTARELSLSLSLPPEKKNTRRIFL
jgi:hypothetical protein